MYHCRTIIAIYLSLCTITSREDTYQQEPLYEIHLYSHRYQGIARDRVWGVVRVKDKVGIQQMGRDKSRDRRNALYTYIRISCNGRPGNSSRSSNEDNSGFKGSYTYLFLSFLTSTTPIPSYILYVYCILPPKEKRSRAIPGLYLLPYYHYLPTLYASIPSLTPLWLSLMSYYPYTIPTPAFTSFPTLPSNTYSLLKGTGPL